MSDPDLVGLAEALKSDGFKLRITSTGPSFLAMAHVRGIAIPMRLQYASNDLAEPPRVFVDQVEKLTAGVIAHLDEANELCVVDRREYIADRYAVAGQARGIVRRAAELLERGLTKAGPLEIAAEFPRHWGGQVVRVSFAPTRSFAKLDPEKPKVQFDLCPTAPPASEVGAVVVATSAQLSFLNSQARPNTLVEVLDWAKVWDATLPDRILDALAALHPADPFAIIYAPNGVVAFQVKVSSRGARVMTSILKPGSWNRLLRGKFGRNLPVTRYQGLRVDTAYLLGTNSVTGTAPLAGRTVVLVGCGAIGGFLSHALAQFGAGVDGGTLILVDHEELEARNTARHKLGAAQVGTNKALACKASIDAALPDLSVSALPLKVEQAKSRVLAADIVIDATGEQAVGDLLNAWRIACTQAGEAAPALLHTWVVGNGAAVESYFSSDPDFGCYRCLHPNLLERQPRFPVLRAEADVSRSTGCGEDAFAPYGPAAPMAAASLAANHAVDWARSVPRPLLRTVRLSYSDTIDRKPTNPSKSDKCPACASH
jgi:hypothetical protein